MTKLFKNYFWLIFLFTLILNSCHTSQSDKFIRIKSKYNDNNWTEFTGYNNDNNYNSSINNNPNKKIEYIDTYYDQPDNSYKGHYKIGKPYKIDGIKYYPKEYNEYSEQGIASWYGLKFHGKKTANGEIYNMNELTAAHRILPMPVIVKVTNLENNKSVILRVNDRGPFAKDRIIDLSKAAAQRLEFIDKGTAKVQIELLPKETEDLLNRLGLL